MTRIIALEEGLDDIGEFLQNRGFKIVPWDEQNPMVDAVVYTGRKLKSLNNDQNYGALTSAIGDFNNKPFGVLLVNAKDRTPEEVYQIIKNRVYENIF